MYYRVNTQCPQCGATVILGETDHLVQCSFCRTRHVIAADPYPCFYLEPGSRMAGIPDMLFIPYWRIRGMAFRQEDPRTGFRVMDQSFPGIQGGGWPVSLGLRPQARALRFVRRDMDGRFFPAGVGADETLRRMDRGESGMVFIRELLSLIYMPFFIENGRVRDGLTGEPLDISEPDLSGLESSPAGLISFIPGFCPDCGWDLAGDARSLVLFCRNCTSFRLISRQKLEPLAWDISAFGPGTRILIPFWGYQIRLDALACSTYADLIRLANLPKPVRPDHENQALRFYVPAFKTAPKLFLRIGRQMTVSQVPPSGASRLPDIPLLPVDLPPEEGLRGAFAVLSSLAVRKKEKTEILAAGAIEALSVRLMYVAFAWSGGDYLEESTGISLPAGTIRGKDGPDAIRNPSGKV